MRVEESVIIHRPVEDVFGFLEVRSNDAAWMASVLESQWLNSTAADSDTPIELGRRGRMIMKLSGRRAEFIDEVTEYEPGRRIAHRTISGPIPLETACICEPAGDSCRATVSVPPSSLAGLSDNTPPPWSRESSAAASEPTWPGSRNFSSCPGRSGRLSEAVWRYRLCMRRPGTNVSYRVLDYCGPGGRKISKSPVSSSEPAFTR
jgi:hypothetical protein